MHASPLMKKINLKAEEGEEVHKKNLWQFHYIQDLSLDHLSFIKTMRFQIYLENL